MRYVSSFAFRQLFRSGYVTVFLGLTFLIAQGGWPESAAAQEVVSDSADVEAERRLIPESYGITDLVVDETRTTIGRDFYDVFYNAWEAPEGSVNYTVVVEEQPVPGFGTRVIVRLNDDIAFDTRLQPRYEIIRDAALAAVYYTRRALTNAAPLSRGL